MEIHESPISGTPHTSLPIKQIFILLFLRFCESLSTYAIFPFLNELLISVTGGDKEGVGYYAGAMEVTRHSVSVITTLYWSRLSDRIGRKPVLIIGTTALAISMFCFGLSKTFLGLVLSRCIFTGFSSNAGIVKGTIGEITDESNRADAFALLHIPWTVGAFIGPLLGGSLSNPHGRFPGMFESNLWLKYPYFLPCATVVAVTVIGVILMAKYLEETVKGGIFSPVKLPEVGAQEHEETQALLSPTSTSPSPTMETPIPLRELLQYHTLLPSLKYAALAFLHTCFSSIQPLFLSMSISTGGLGLKPATIGYVLGSYGATNALVQTFLLGPIVRWMSANNVYTMSTLMFVPIFSLSPAMNALAREGGVSGLVWFLLVVQLLCSIIMELGYGCTYILITEAAPNKRSLGSMNGFAQTLASISRILAPALSGSLLSFSIEHRLLHGYAGYVFLACATLACYFLFRRAR